MAGIGFVLRKLSKKDDLFGVLRASFHSALAATGPWVLTVLSLTGIVMVGQQILPIEELFIFKIIITYNFAFSLVLSAPIFTVRTRYVADKLFVSDAKDIPGLLIGALLTIFITQLPLTIWFYFFYANFTSVAAFIGVVNMLTCSCMWLTCLFSTALKDYKTISFAFVTGLMVSFFAAIFLADSYGAIGMVLGFTIGQAYILSFLSAKVYLEYGYVFTNPFKYLSYFRKCKYLALGSFFYCIAIWIDKWIMWFAPGGQKSDSNLYINADYDSAMFLAFLTIVPTMGLFIYSVETTFYDSYIKFCREINAKATLATIYANHKDIVSTIMRSSVVLFTVQLVICLAVMRLAPLIMFTLDLPARQISIFRFGVAGATFHAFFTFTFIILSYFTGKKILCYIQLIFLLTNASFTWFFMNKGIEYAGHGYFLSSLVAFVITIVVTIYYLKHLVFHTFITTNSSVD